MVYFVRVGVCVLCAWVYLSASVMGDFEPVSLWICPCVCVACMRVHTCSYHKPHLPFRFPVKFGNYDDVWQEAYFPMEEVALPTAQYFPVDIPPVALACVHVCV
jgi:hypothetical protein